MTQCLCIGPTGSGKTLLLKRLQGSPVQGVSTVETVGSNIVQVPKGPLGGDGEKTRSLSMSMRSGIDDSMSVREVGGSIAPLWPSYYAPDKLILYTIDSSNLFQVSISTVLLMEILTHEKLNGAKILVVLTKSDLTDTKKRNYLKFMMRLDAIVTQAGRRVTLLEASAMKGDGVQEIKDWLVKNWPKENTRRKQ